MITTRNYLGRQDAERVAQLMNATREKVGPQPDAVTAEQIHARFEDSSIESSASDDVHLFFVGDQLIGFERTRRETWASGARVYHLGPFVHPEWKTRQTFEEIVAQICRYQSEIAQRDRDAADGSPFLAVVLPDPESEGIRDVLLTAGFACCHASVLMERSLDEAAVPIDLPAGLEVRPLQTKHHRDVYAFDRRIMRESWGCEAPSETHFRWWSKEAFLDPGLWCVAWFGNEIVGTAAGVVGGTWNPRLGDGRAEIRFVRVDPKWRRRGVATTLIQRCMAALHARGVRQVELGVDEAKEASAIALYRSLGFEVSSRSVAYRYDLQPHPE